MRRNRRERRIGGKGSSGVEAREGLIGEGSDGGGTGGWGGGERGAGMGMGVGGEKEREQKEALEWHFTI